MPSRANPYFTGNYANPGMADVARSLGTLASVFAPAPAEDPEVTALKEAQARQREMAAALSAAHARVYDANAAEQLMKNQALGSAPSTLAQLFTQGGRFQDEPVTMNPNYTEPPPPNLSLVPDYGTRPTEISSMFTPGQTAADKMGAALQEYIIRGGKLDDFAKLLGQAGYLGNVQGGTPDQGMPYMPLFGQAPTTNTALTTTRQDAMSARDAAEAFKQALSVAQTNVAGRESVAQINQAGAASRQAQRLAERRGVGGGRSGGVGTGGRSQRERQAAAVKPPTIPALGAPLASKLKGQINDFLENQGYTVEPSALDAMFIEASRQFQDPGSKAFKNPVLAAANVAQAVQDGTFEGATTETTKPGALRSWFGAKSESRVKALPRAPTPATGASAPAGAVRPPAAAIRYLQANPKLAAEFDRKYGRGLSTQYLK